MKKLSIITINHLERSDKGGYFKEVTEAKILTDKTTLQETKILNELNEKKRIHKWSIRSTYNFKLKRDCNRFLQELYSNIELFKYSESNKELLKNESIEIIKNIK